MDLQNNRNLTKKELIFATLLIIILLVGMGVRIYKLGSRDLWFDEDISLYVAKNFNFACVRPNPPLYYLLLSFWIRFLEKTEFVLRFLSMIFGILSIFMIYKVGKLFFDKRVGLISAFIISISPIHIWYSQEAKGYALSVFLIMITTYFFILALKENRNHLWVGFILSAILSIYTNYFSFLIILPEVIIISLKKYRRLIKKWLISCLFIAILFSPWGLSFLRDIVAIRESFWIPKPSLKSIFITFENFNVGYNAIQIVYSISIFLYLLLLILGILYAKKEKSVILLSFLFLPVIITFGVSQWIPIYIDRQLILFSPFYYLLIAAGLMKTKRPSIRTLFLGSIFILSISSLYNYHSDYMPSPYIHHLGAYTKKPFKPVVRYIKENFKKGDIIVHAAFAIYNPFVTYWDSEPTNQYYFIIPHAQDPYWSRIIQERALKRRKPEVIDLTKSIKGLDPERIWLITSSWARDGNLDSNSLAVTKWMEQHYIRRESKEFDGIFVGLYEQKD